MTLSGKTIHKLCDVETEQLSVCRGGGIDAVQYERADLCANLTGNGLKDAGGLIHPVKQAPDGLLPQLAEYAGKAGCVTFAFLGNAVYGNGRKAEFLAEMAHGSV